MVTRRSFLYRTALASSVAALPTASAFAGKNDGCQSLPASIAALKSMESLARPITSTERLTRQERARSLMAGSKLAAIVLTAGSSLEYYTGVHWWGGERLFAFLLPLKGEPFFVCPAFEEDRAREQIAKGPFAQLKVLLWQENENPYQRVAHGLRDLGLAAGTLGVDETAPYAFSSGIAQAAPALTLASATGTTAGCRMIKSAHEIELMRLAAKVSLAAYKATYQALREGMTHEDVARLVTLAHKQLGFEGEADVQVGLHTANPHGSVAPQVVREGTILMIDGGCRVEGYVSDITRTFVLGKAAEKMRRIFEIVRRAQSAALATARPGMPAETVDAAARNLITAAGYGPGYKYFRHRVGHGMGMDGHEWPYLVGGNTLPLAPNMVFSDEPGIYLPGEFGIRLEDDMHITATGSELFTPQSPSLEQPFAS
jgi:Xaa-Pro dipeptidase